MLESYLVTAAVDFARVDTGNGELDVYCTHFASVIDNITYQGAYASWEEEQAGQIAETLAFVDANSDGSRPIVLMGDLNTGPGEMEQNYAQLIADGFDNHHDGDCSLCPENTFRTSDSRLLVDHILVKGVGSPVRSSLVMTDTVSIDVDGARIVTSYSDHYGVAASSCFTAPM